MITVGSRINVGCRITVDPLTYQKKTDLQMFCHLGAHSLIFIYIFLHYKKNAKELLFFLLKQPNKISGETKLPYGSGDIKIKILKKLS